VKILYVANGGFGDASWTTSWPRLFTERGHEIDVFLMQHTGNPFHANPFIRNMFVEEKMEAAKKIMPVIEGDSYDIVIVPDNTMAGMLHVKKVIKNVKNVYFFKDISRSQVVSDLEIPPFTKPEWYFTEKEFKYIEDLKIKNSVLFHPISSSVYEESRNIDFNLIIECSKKIKDIVVLYGGRKCLPIESLKKMETAGIRLLWEDYNCFNDESGTALGKFLALTSQCQVSVHGWSGSFLMSAGYNKPYIFTVPGYKIRANPKAPYFGTKETYLSHISQADKFNSLNPSAWCITEETEVIIEAINYVLEGKTGIYDKTWTFLKGKIC